MAGIKKPAKQTTETVITQPIELPEDGMVTILFKGEEKLVTVQLAKTLINKGAATLKA